MDQQHYVRLDVSLETTSICVRLMSVPGVGVIVAFAYMAVIDDPSRFKQSTSVGAYLGLTPRRYRFGEVDKAGRISKCDDGLPRSYLFEAANVLLVRHPKPSRLRTWGLEPNKET